MRNKQGSNKARGRDVQHRKINNSMGEALMHGSAKQVYRGEACRYAGK